MGHPSNIINDGFHSYTYDAENRLFKVDNGATATYVYDAHGRRVKNGTYEFAYDLAGRAVALFGSSSGVWNYGEIYAGARHIATYSGATTNFIHADWLGTKRVMTGLTGTNSQTCTSLPFGDGLSCTGTEWGFNHFTDDFHDSESNLEHTWFRQLTTTQGRWTSPDPYLGSMDIGNPQSLNRFAYVLNDPVDFLDPLGLKHGNDCNGGPCTPFIYLDANGCYEFIDFYQVKGPDGTYDMPYVAGTICPGSGGNGGGGNGGGGGSSPTQASPAGTPSLNAQCLNHFYNTDIGKAVDFGSIGGFIPGWSPNFRTNVKDLVLLGTMKYGGLAGVGQAATKLDVLKIESLQISNIEKGLFVKEISSTAGTGLKLGLKGLGRAGSFAMVAATLFDATVHFGCAIETGPVSPEDWQDLSD